MSDAPEKKIPYEIPPEGSLGLLALGYRGIEAWRAVRGTEWIEERRKQAEAKQAAKAAQASASKKADGKTVASPDAAPSVSFEGLSLVVVSGLPRSGTSMLMQMLTAGGLTAFTDEAREADASNPRGYYEHERIKTLARDKAWLSDADGRVVKVVAPLLPHLPRGPRYRVLLLERDLDQVLRSQAAMLERQGRPVADTTVLRNAYTRHLALARAWVARQPDAEALVLDHAAVISDPTQAASRVAEFLDGFIDAPTFSTTALDAAAMAGIVDPTLHRQRTS